MHRVATEHCKEDIVAEKRNSTNHRAKGHGFRMRDPVSCPATRTELKVFAIRTTQRDCKH